MGVTDEEKASRKATMPHNGQSWSRVMNEVGAPSEPTEHVLHVKIPDTELSRYPINHPTTFNRVRALKEAHQRWKERQRYGIAAQPAGRRDAIGRTIESGRTVLGTALPGFTSVSRS